MPSLSKILLFTLSFVLAFVLGLALAGYILEDKLTESALRYLNKQINAELKVENVKVSLLRGFPNASVILKSFKIGDSNAPNPSDQEPGLLSLEEVVIKTSLFGALRNEFNVQQIVLKNGWINLYYDPRGKGNFEIFNTDKDTNTEWFLNIDEFSLKNVSLSYIDLNTGWILKGQLEDVNISGNLSDKEVDLVIKAITTIGVLRQGSFYYIRNEKVGFSTAFKLSKNEIDIKPSKGYLAKSNLNFSGFIGRTQGSPVYLEVSGQDFGVDPLVSFLTQHSLSLPHNSKTRGSIAFTLKLEGYNKSENPFSVNLDFLTKSLQLEIPNRPLLNLNALTGSFNNGKLGKPESSEITISQFQLQTGGSFIDGSLQIKNLLSPLYHINANPRLSIKDILNWGVEIPITDGYLQGDFEALGMLDGLNDLSLISFENSKFYSSIDLSGITFNQAGSIPDIRGVSGNIRINNKDISNAKFSGLIHGSRFEVDLKISNATALLFHNQKATVNTSLVIDSLNTGWLTFTDTTTSSQEKSSSSWNYINSISGDIFIDKLVHNQFVAAPLSANFYIKDENFLFNSFLTRTCDGVLTGRLSVSKGDANNFNLFSDIDADGINIQEMLRSFDNFNQEVLTDQNLSGTLDGAIMFTVPLENGKANANKLDATATLKISNGRLVNLRQLESLSRFIELEELKDIRFSTLENTLRVSDSIIVIPDMDVNSSAINLRVSGTHSLRGEYQYRIQLNLSDVLFNKATRRKAENQEFGVVEDDGSGKTKIFLKLEGDSNDFKVSYDGAGARESFRESLRREKLNIKTILRDEFSFFNRIKRQSDSLKINADSLGVVVKTVKKPAKGKDNPPKFIIEWD
jgi:hypothetical protein